MIELKTKQRIDKEYLHQDFFLHTRPNGEQYYVSYDHRFYFIPK